MNVNVPTQSSARDNPEMANGVSAVSPVTNPAPDPTSLTINLNEELSRAALTVSSDEGTSIEILK